MMEPAGEKAPGNGFDPEPHPAREMSLHLLRMLETRMDAAGIAFQAETQRVMARLQLKLLAAAAIFIAIWGGIVLLAISLPENLRVPVLSAVVIGFVIAGVACQLVARRKASTREVGSLAWFLDSLRLDLEVLSRTLARSQAQPQEPQPQPEPERNPPSDIAA
ncbi:MAG: hypothetical protein WDO72_00650 [Pseudomonadota bacterium]